MWQALLKDIGACFFDYPYFRRTYDRWMKQTDPVIDAIRKWESGEQGKDEIK